MSTLDFTAGRSFMTKPINDCKTIVEVVASNYGICGRENTSRRIALGKYEVSNNDMLMAKVKPLSLKIDKWKRPRLML